MSSPAATQPITDISSGAMPEVQVELTASWTPSARQAAPAAASTHWVRLVARPIQTAVWVSAPVRAGFLGWSSMPAAY